MKCAKISTTKEPQLGVPGSLSLPVSGHVFIETVLFEVDASPFSNQCLCQELALQKRKQQQRNNKCQGLYYTYPKLLDFSFLTQNEVAGPKAYL